jgi:hypothetical protein
MSRFRVAYAIPHVAESRIEKARRWRAAFTTEATKDTEGDLRKGICFDANNPAKAKE